MDNLKYYNNSLAYDFSMFEEKKKEEKADVVKMPSRAREKKSVAKNVLAIFSKLSSAITVTVVLALIFGNLFLRSKISETTAKINETKKQIEIYDSEETRLNVEYEQIVSYGNLENAAHDLGMKKMDKSQVVYIRVNDTDAAKNSDGMLIDADE